MGQTGLFTLLSKTILGNRRTVPEGMLNDYREDLSLWINLLSVEQGPSPARTLPWRFAVLQRSPCLLNHPILECSLSRA